MIIMIGTLTQDSASLAKRCRIIKIALDLKLKDVKRDVRGSKGRFQIPRFDLLGLLCPLGGQANQTETRWVELSKKAPTE